MFFPTIGMLLTRLITRQGFSDMMIKPRFKDHIREYLLAYFAPAAFAILGTAVYFLIFPGKLDLTFGYFRRMIASAGASLEEQGVSMGALIAVQVAQAFLLSGLVNLIPALGEEWGWRGYMMPRMLKTMKPVPALLLGGLIWGVWHAPLTAIGHNYGMDYPFFPWLGIAMMCVFCVTTGILLTWLTERTGSCIPAALAHGAINGTEALGMLFTADGGEVFLGPAPTGLIGILPMMAAAAAAAVWFVKHPKADTDENGEA